MSFGILDIVIIVLVLLFAIVGLSKGFVQLLGKSIAFLGAFLAATFLFKLLTQALVDSPIYTTLFDKLYAWLEGKGDIMLVTVADAGEEGIKEALGAMGIPQFLRNMVLKQIAPTIEASPDMLVGEFFATFLASTILSIASYAGIYLVALIILLILVGYMKKLRDISIFGGLDKILGLALNVVIGVGIISLLLIGLSFLVTLPGIGDTVNAFVTKDMKLEEDVFSIAKFLYQHNPILWILDKFGMGDIFKKKSEEEVEASARLLKTLLVK